MHYVTSKFFWRNLSVIDWFWLCDCGMSWLKVHVRVRVFDILRLVGWCVDHRFGDILWRFFFLFRSSANHIVLVRISQSAYRCSKTNRKQSGLFSTVRETVSRTARGLSASGGQFTPDVFGGKPKKNKRITSKCIGRRMLKLKCQRGGDESDQIVRLLT